MKTCRTCDTPKPLDEFQKDNRRKDGHTALCLICAAASANAWHHKNREHHNAKIREWGASDKKKNPHKYLWTCAKRRSAEDGRPFNITPDDLVVPEICPVFGCKLEFGVKQYSPVSPSVDCIRPELGYTKGNVAVISHRANTIKQNATPEELRQVAAWLEGALRSEPLPTVN